MRRRSLTSIIARTHGPAYPAAPSEVPTGGEQVYALHQELIGLRCRRSWLHVYEVAAGDNRLTVALNIGDESLILEPTSTALPETVAARADREGERISVPPHAWAILGR